MRKSIESTRSRNWRSYSRRLKKTSNCMKWPFQYSRKSLKNWEARFQELKILKNLQSRRSKGDNRRQMQLKRPNLQDLKLLPKQKPKAQELWHLRQHLKVLNGASLTKKTKTNRLKLKCSRKKCSRRNKTKSTNSPISLRLNDRSLLSCKYMSPTSKKICQLLRRVR